LVTSTWPSIFSANKKTSSEAAHLDAALKAALKCALAAAAGVDLGFDHHPGAAAGGDFFRRRPHFGERISWRETFLSGTATPYWSFTASNCLA
jgi:hypothetical protein